MNLLTDPWLPVLRADNSTEKIAPWQITDKLTENPIIDIQAPRPDFRNALYQFFIGLLQVSACPADEEKWEESWEKPPSPHSLKKSFLKYETCFEIDSKGPAFMQDFELKEGEKKTIAALLIESPGDKTLKDNTDHFIKGGRIKGMSPYWAAVALFTLQINAPSGGVGHRTGMRGGGPLTTLLLPDENKGPVSFWHQLWLNSLPETELSDLSGSLDHQSLESIFPWMAPSKTSEKKQVLTPEEGHPGQMYFSMPRRIRLDFENTQAGICDLSGEDCSQLVTSYHTKNYGINYSPTWIHPLNAYSAELLPIKGQPGGVVYRHWLGLVVNSERQNIAKVLEYFQKSYDRQEVLGETSVRLWAAGYDMDNMKARCWYEAIMPVYSLKLEEQKRLEVLLKELIEAASESLNKLIWFLRTAWFEKPEKQSKKEKFHFIELAFWQQTEAYFYQSLKELVAHVKGSKQSTDTYQAWPGILKDQCFYLFDLWASSGPAEDQDMKRWAQARQKLGGWFKAAKEITNLYTRQNNMKKAA